MSTRPKFIILDGVGSAIYDDLSDALDKVSDLNYQTFVGVWEAYKAYPLTREDIEKYLPNVNHPSVRMLLDETKFEENKEPEVPPFIAFLNDASKQITWQGGEEEAKEITVSFYPDGTFMIIDGQDNLPTWYQFE